MRALLDVNVLLALLDAEHVDHRRATDWLLTEIEHGWSSCAITQNGFVRIISQPRYPNPITSAEAIELLGRATSTEHHAFWSCQVSLLDARLVDRSRIYGPLHLTDAYLLALATAHDGRLVTFDRNVPRTAVPAARPENLVVL